MGCCEDTQRRTMTKTILEYEAKSKLDAGQPTEEGVRILRELVRHYKAADWTEVSKFVTCFQRVDPGNVPDTGQLSVRPRTVGAAALFYLCLCPEQQVREQVCRQNASAVLHTLEEAPPDTQQFAFAFLDLALQNRPEALLQTFVELGAFKVLLWHLDSADSHLRKMAAVLSGVIFREYAPAQQAFLQGGGATKLVQLISRETENDQTLNDLLECVIDLVTVSGYLER